MADKLELDGIDRQILEILQGNARTTNSEIARQLQMAPSAILERIRKLELRGVVTGYQAQVNPRALDLNIVAFIFVRSEEKVGNLDTGLQLAEVPGVLEVHNVAGEDCYLIKVRAAGTEALGKLIREQIGAIESVRSTRTTIVLNSIKETMQLPIRMGDREVKA